MSDSASRPHDVGQALWGVAIEKQASLAQGFRASDLRTELKLLACRHGPQEVVNAALAVKEEWEWAKRIREAG